MIPDQNQQHQEKLQHLIANLNKKDPSERGIKIDLNWSNRYKNLSIIDINAEDEKEESNDTRT